MFLWKNAVVLVGLLAFAMLPAMMLVRNRWEKIYIGRIVVCGMLVSCLAVSALPMLGTQLIYMLLLLACFDRRVPMSATYLFFLFWSPAAGSLLALAGAYIAPLTPFMAFSAALLVGYVVTPASHLRRRMLASDVYFAAFILIYCTCMSLREPPTGIARTVVSYGVPYIITYFTLSRVRIARPELVLRLMVLGAAAAGLLCIFETIRHWPLYAGIMGVKNEMWAVDVPRAWLQRGGVLRAFGPFAHPLTGGAMLALAAIGAWGLWQIRGRSWPVAALGVAILLGLASTLSRSGLIAVAAGLMIFQLLRRRYLLALVMPIAGLAMVVGLPILGGADAQFSTTYRLEIITGVPATLGNKIWFGYREAVKEGLLDDFIQGQGIVDLVNSYLGIVVRGGVVSLIPYLLFLISAFPHYRAIRRMNPAREQLLLAQTLIAIHGAIIIALPLLNAWSAPMQLSFVIVALLVALRAEVKTHGADAPGRPSALTGAMAETGETLPMLR